MFVPTFRLYFIFIYWIFINLKRYLSNNFCIKSIKAWKTNWKTLPFTFKKKSDRNEMHRYKLSPRGKLYLKTDAEGKQSTATNWYWKLDVVRIARYFFAMIFHFVSRFAEFLLQNKYQFSLRVFLFFCYTFLQCLKTDPQTRCSILVLIFLSALTSLCSNANFFVMFSNRFLFNMLSSVTSTDISIKLMLHT